MHTSLRLVLKELGRLKPVWRRYRSGQHYTLAVRVTVEVMARSDHHACNLLRRSGLSSRYPQQILKRYDGTLAFSLVVHRPVGFQRRR